MQLKIINDENAQKSPMQLVDNACPDQLAHITLQRGLVRIEKDSTETTEFDTLVLTTETEISLRIRAV